MEIHPVTFIAFKEYDNLGVGYLSSVLSEAGYETIVIDFANGKKEILKILKNIKPIIVGFSLIFQYHIYEFEELIIYLRKGGIKCHFTAGGQYASLKYEDLFEIIPSIDSIVRFEGEYTFLNLVNCINTGKDWKNISGIAYKCADRVILNPVRPVETDLDKFPLPIREPLKEYAFGKKFATILAGRGCVNSCSFCSVNEYYKQSSGPYKRLRSPEKVVEEMELLYNEMDCSVFLFQDDDFPVKTQNGSEWISRFCKELKRKELTNKIMWKINCRPDEIDHNSFALMKNFGLFLVFLGIEDGTDIGLTLLNKHMSIAKCLKGINILKTLKIDFDYGFMPFQPSTTYLTLKDNLNFLRGICGDGYTPVTFHKVMPFCATAIEKELRREGRLKGKPGFQDYDFHEESMNYYYDFITDCFMEWLRAPDGLLNISKWAKNYLSVFSRFYESQIEISESTKEVMDIISESNIFILETLEELAAMFKEGKYSRDYSDLSNYKRKIKIKHNLYKEAIKNVVTKLLIFFEFHKQASFIFSL
jgi:radical SAM superfamily enzyme YgiQ (UPF0313 family)